MSRKFIGELRGEQASFLPQHVSLAIIESENLGRYFVIIVSLMYEVHLQNFMASQYLGVII